MEGWRGNLWEDMKWESEREKKRGDRKEREMHTNSRKNVGKKQSIKLGRRDIEDGFIIFSIKTHLTIHWGQ